MPGDSEGLEVGLRAISLPFTKETVSRLPWDKMGAFPAFPEIARRHPEAMAVVLPILDLFSHSYGPKLLELERGGGDPDRLVPQIKIEDLDRRVDALKMFFGNMCLWPDASNVEGAVSGADWKVLGACFPSADYPTAVYLKYAISLAIDGSVFKSLYRVWPEALSFKDPEAVQKEIFNLTCPHIPYFLVGSPEESEPDAILDRLDYPSPWPERPSCPLDRFEDPRNPGGERFLYLFNLPGIRKPILAVAVYPDGRKNLKPFKDRELLIANLLSCYPVDNPRRVYEKKVKGKSSWGYLRFARELWVHSARRWARDPENSLSPRKVQRRHLSVREIYGLSSPVGGT